MDSGEIDEVNVLVTARCGTCATWRSETLNWIRAERALRRIKRMQRRQRRVIERDLRVLTAIPAAGYEPPTRLRAAK
jgi:hypothetical protein